MLTLRKQKKTLNFHHENYAPLSAQYKKFKKKCVEITQVDITDVVQNFQKKKKKKKKNRKIAGFGRHRSMDPSSVTIVDTNKTNLQACYICQSEVNATAPFKKQK